MFRYFTSVRIILAATAAVVMLAATVPCLTWAAPAVQTSATAPVAADDDGSAPRLMVMADFNHDGIADIAEIIPHAGKHSEASEVVLSLGRADGSYRRIAATLAVGHAPQAIVIGDFNRDGNADLMVGDDDGTLRVFLGDGKGNFVLADNTPRLASVVSIAVADFNHDGIPDVAVSDWRSSSVTVLLGAGDGTFRKGWSFPLRLAGTTPHLVTADFNHDRVPDLAVVYDDDDGDTFDVMLGNGNGMFTYAPSLSLTKDPSAACVPEQMANK